MNAPVPVAPLKQGGYDAVHLIVLTGMSGGGKTVALHALEDLGFYCVDNLPSTLLLPLLEHCINPPHGGRRIAVGVDVRNRSEDLQHMPWILSSMADKGMHIHLIFLDCSDAVLIKRYSETRRRHPMAQAGVSLSQAIAQERRLLRSLMAVSQKIIDSSELNVHQLRRMIAVGYAQKSEGLTLMFQSFAFKRGLPLDSDFIFDARCLPNPHWEPKLRLLSGKDEPTRQFLKAQPVIHQYLTDITRWLETWLPSFERDDRSYVTFSLGCTGGRHRSVYLVEQLGAHFRAMYDDVLIFHRELE